MPIPQGSHLLSRSPTSSHLQFPGKTAPASSMSHTPFSPTASPSSSSGEAQPGRPDQSQGPYQSQGKPASQPGKLGPPKLLPSSHSENCFPVRGTAPDEGSGPGTGELPGRDAQARASPSTLGENLQRDTHPLLAALQNLNRARPSPPRTLPSLRRRGLARWPGPPPQPSVSRSTE